jgi:hypothetical protein
MIEDLSSKNLFFNPKERKLLKDGIQEPVMPGEPLIEG